MKKTVITILILLAAVFGLFASTEVEVTLSLKKQPKYVYGVTSAVLEETTAANLTNVDAVLLERADNSEKIRMVDGYNYYVSYMFYEYESVSLVISTSGDLTNEYGQKVPFSVYIPAGTDNVVTSINKDAVVTQTKEVSFNSNDETASATLVTYDTETNVIGDYVYASLPLTIGAVGDNDLRGMIDSTFTANIVLTVVSNN